MALRFPKLSRPIWWIIGILLFGVGLGLPFCRVWQWGAAGMRQYDLDERLWGAAGEGRTALVQHLLDEGANINYVDAGQSVLQLAVSSGEPKTVRVLLDRGVKVNGPDSLGCAALRDARDHHNAGMVDMLKKAGATEWHTP